MFSEILIRFLKKESGRIFIQPHNYPDPDAVSSAYGLREILSARGLEAEIIYEGELQRDALVRMINELRIPLHHWKHYGLNASDRIIVVDGCKGNANVLDLPGREVAVIDHHKSKTTEDISLKDIRPHYGSCSTMICEYYQEQKLIPSKQAASALHIGLARDTDLYTRGMGTMDLKALSFLYPHSDTEKVNSILRNNIQLSDLDYFRSLLQDLKYKQGLAFCFLPEECPQNLMGILVDFVLSLQEVHFAALFSRRGENISLSFRNNRPDRDASLIMKRFTAKIGQGGGHKEMAGGSIAASAAGEPEKFFIRLLKLLDPEDSPKSGND